MRVFYQRVARDYITINPANRRQTKNPANIKPATPAEIAMINTTPRLAGGTEMLGCPVFIFCEYLSLSCWIMVLVLCLALLRRGGGACLCFSCCRILPAGYTSGCAGERHSHKSLVKYIRSSSEIIMYVPSFNQNAIFLHNANLCPTSNFRTPSETQLQRR